MLQHQMLPPAAMLDTFDIIDIFAFFHFRLIIIIFDIFFHYFRSRFFHYASTSARYFMLRDATRA